MSSPAEGLGSSSSRPRRQNAPCAGWGWLPAVGTGPGPSSLMDAALTEITGEQKSPSSRTARLQADPAGTEAPSVGKKQSLVSSPAVCRGFTIIFISGAPGDQRTVGGYHPPPPLWGHGGPHVQGRTPGKDLASVSPSEVPDTPHPRFTELNQTPTPTCPAATTQTFLQETNWKCSCLPPGGLRLVLSGPLLLPPRL